MTRFTLTLVARSGRWLAPTILFALWLALILTNSGPALDNGTNMFFPTLVFSVWITAIAGNVDDDPHRDLCAAAAGSPARLHSIRALAAAITGVAVAVVTAFLTAAAGARAGHGYAYVWACTTALLIGGALLGTAIGGFLHRPLLRNVAWSFVLAAAAVIALILPPPVRRVLDDFDRGKMVGLTLLCAAALVAAVCATAASAALTERRS